MWLLEDVAVLAVERGRPVEAFVLAGTSDALRTATGAPRPQAAETALAGRLEPAMQAIGPIEAAAARSRGTSLGTEQAISEAIDAARGVGAL